LRAQNKKAAGAAFEGAPAASRTSLKGGESEALAAFGGREGGTLEK